MKLFFLPHPTKTQKDEPDKHLLAIVHEEHNIIEGSEFLNDAIRMKDQPFILMRTEESIAPGCPEGLL